jgi:hypothetical protein
VLFPSKRGTEYNTQTNRPLCKEHELFSSILHISEIAYTSGFTERQGFKQTYGVWKVTHAKCAVIQATSTAEVTRLVHSVLQVLAGENAEFHNFNFPILSLNYSVYEGVSKSFRTGRLKRELQMVQLSATRCSCSVII